MTIKKKLASRTLVVFYLLVMMEGILMASPFGLFLYSFYDPFLSLMGKSPITAWVASFFLPQSVYQTGSPLVNFIKWYGPYLFYLGITGFLIFAIQIYWAKLRRKGMVANFVYSYIRHPQYLFFMISGLGLLCIWPRMMMLILFTLMCLIYFYLAKHEEGQMLAKHPEYAEYMKKTAMFIPGSPGGRLFDGLLGWIPHRKVSHTVSILLFLGLMFGGAAGLRSHSIANLSTAEIPDMNIIAISIFPHSETYIKETIGKCIAHGEVKRTLLAEGDVSFIAHILPADHGMLGKYMEIDTQTRNVLLKNFHNRSSLRNWLWGTDSEKVKVVFSKVGKPDRVFVPLDEILDMSAKMTPVLVADLNLETDELVKTIKTSTTYYGDVPQPMF